MFNGFIIQQAYYAGIAYADNKELIHSGVIHEFYTNFFINLLNKISSKVKRRFQNEIELFDNIDVFRNLHHNEIIIEEINDALFDNNISQFSIASDVELSVQTSFIKGYLENQRISDGKSFEFELSVRGGPSLITDWLCSLLQLCSYSADSSTLDDNLRIYFELGSCSSFHAIFSEIEKILAEDGWVTKRNRYGKIYRFEIKDDIYFGNVEILGGSYVFVKHFSNSQIHEVHHLIPAKLLKMTGILEYADGPSIRMEIKDHKLTRSYKRRNMLNDKYFQNQLCHLEAHNIKAAVEMEIADIQSKFGTKYDDALREVIKYVSELEKTLKNKKGVVYA